MFCANYTVSTTNYTVNTTCQRHMDVTDAFWVDSQRTNVHLNVIVTQFYCRFNQIPVKITLFNIYMTEKYKDY